MPASGAYCLGSRPPKRAPPPPAGTRTKIRAIVPCALQEEREALFVERQETQSLVEAPGAFVAAGDNRSRCASHPRRAGLRERRQHGGADTAPLPVGVNRDVVELGDQRATRRRNGMADNAGTHAPRRARRHASSASQTNPISGRARNRSRARVEGSVRRRRRTRRRTRGSGVVGRGTCRAACWRHRASPCVIGRTQAHCTPDRRPTLTASAATHQRLRALRPDARQRRTRRDSRGPGCRHARVDPHMHEAPRCAADVLARAEQRDLVDHRRRAELPTRRPASMRLGKRQRMMEAARRLDDDADRRGIADVEAARADQVLVHRRCRSRSSR